MFSPQLVIFLFEQFVPNVRIIKSNWLFNPQQKKRENITQESLALQCGIDRSYMGRIERGEVNITVEKLYEIASAMQIPAKDLIP